MIIALVAMVLIGVGVFVVKPWDSGDDAKQAKRTTRASVPRTPRPSKHATYDTQPEGPIPDADGLGSELGTYLPTESTISQVHRVGVPNPTLGGTWKFFDQGGFSGGTEQSACADDSKATTGYGRRFVLKPASGVGQFGDAQVTILEFPTPQDAAAFVAEHTGTRFTQCQRRVERNDTKVGSPGATTKGEHLDARPSEAGFMVRYRAVITVRGRRCPAFRDTWWESEGRFAVSAAFSSCGAGFDEDTEQSVLADTRSKLAAFH